MAPRWNRIPTPRICAGKVYYECPVENSNDQLPALTAVAFHAPKMMSAPEDIGELECRADTKSVGVGDAIVGCLIHKDPKPYAQYVVCC